MNRCHASLHTTRNPSYTEKEIEFHISIPVGIVSYHHPQGSSSLSPTRTPVVVGVLIGWGSSFTRWPQEGNVVGAQRRRPGRGEARPTDKHWPGNNTHCPRQTAWYPGG
jgi:hypothetical protein